MGRLVLTRKLGQDVFIDIPPSSEPHTIVVGLASIIGDDKAQLTFDAAKDVSIERSEYRQKLHDMRIKSHATAAG